MRLLHVVQRYYPAQGGAERYWQEISERAAADGHTVEVYTTNALDIELFWEPGHSAITKSTDTHNDVLIRRFPLRHYFPTSLGYRGIRRALAIASDVSAPLSLLTALANLAPASPELAHALRSNRTPYDLIAGVNIVYEGLVFAALERARSLNVPFVFCPFTHLGEPGNREVGRFYTMRHQIWLTAQSDAVFVSTPSEARYFEGRGVAGNKLVMMGSGVTPEKILGGDSARAREKYKLDSPLILFLGTVSADKGAAQAVGALAELKARGVDATLVLAGAPVAAFGKFFASQPASVLARCQVLGFVSDEDKRDLLDACRVLVLPSRTDLFPTAYLEAWLYNKPVIGARAGGIPEVIDDDKDGFIVPFGDARGLADKIELLLRDPQRARLMGERGCAKVYSRFTWDRLYARAIHVYERLVARADIRDLAWRSNP